MTFPAKVCGISTRQSHPAMQIRSTPDFVHRSKIRLLNWAQSGNSRRSTTTVGRFALAARSSPRSPAREPITIDIRAFSEPSPIRSRRFCRVVPDPLTSTASLMGRSFIQNHIILRGTGASPVQTLRNECCMGEAPMPRKKANTQSLTRNRPNGGGISQRQVRILRILPHIGPSLPASRARLIYLATIQHLYHDPRPFGHRINNRMKPRADEIFQIFAVCFQPLVCCRITDVVNHLGIRRLVQPGIPSSAHPVAAVTCHAAQTTASTRR